MCRQFVALLHQRRLKLDLINGRRRAEFREGVAGNDGCLGDAHAGALINPLFADSVSYLLHARHNGRCQRRGHYIKLGRLSSNFAGALNVVPQLGGDEQCR